jgi:hypothetical protein
MNYNVKTITVFERQAKRLVKKYASLKKELWELSQQLSKTPKLGTPLGSSCFKVRIITHFLVSDDTVYLLSIYDKSERSVITDKELAELLAGLDSLPASGNA